MMKMVHEKCQMTLLAVLVLNSKCFCFPYQMFVLADGVYGAKITAVQRTPWTNLYMVHAVHGDMMINVAMGDFRTWKCCHFFSP